MKIAWLPFLNNLCLSHLFKHEEHAIGYTSHIRFENALKEFYAAWELKSAKKVKCRPVSFISHNTFNHQNCWKWAVRNSENIRRFHTLSVISVTEILNLIKKTNDLTMFWNVLLSKFLFDGWWWADSRFLRIRTNVNVLENVSEFIVHWNNSYWIWWTLKIISSFEKLDKQC